MTGCARNLLFIWHLFIGDLLCAGQGGREADKWTGVVTLTENNNTIY